MLLQVLSWSLSLISIIFVSLILSSQKVSSSQDIVLPSELKAEARIIRKDREGLWEKTLLITFPTERKTLSTNDGFLEARAVVNHSAHPFIWKDLCEKKKIGSKVGGKVYMEEIRKKIADILSIRPKEVALVATAVDMDNLAVVTKRYEPYIVTALVTAGAKTNALRAGYDEGHHIEEARGGGTVNIIVLTNAILTESAMARAIITVTEAKTSAFQDLKVRSSYSPHLIATGTGTDSVVVVSGTTGPLVTYTGGHSKIGELIAKAVYEAVILGLKKQDQY
ncbi:MAG: adenosylcobinamide amidohydrolase [Sulfolobales archaeon]